MATRPAKSLASFGEVAQVAPSGVGSTKVRGATRMLTLTELKRVGRTLQPTGVEFKFSRENFSAPRGPQTFGITLRTARQDLPGGEEPVEQVLGWNYTPFTVNGVWDDRYAGTNYAESTRRDFEAMVKRGNPVRYQFEQVSITGLITNLNINYQRADRQGYSFTMSPHFRYEGETVRVDPNSARKIVTDPKTAVAKARQGLESLKADQALASIKAKTQVQSLLKTDIFTQIGNGIDEIDTYVTSAEDTVENRILKPGENVVNALNNAAQAMASVKTAASRILSTTRQITTSGQMAGSSLVRQLQFENWQRSVSATTRGLVFTSEQSRQDCAFRAQPKPKRLHRVRGGESLYQISTRYYGTPHHWRDILNANKLSSIILAGGELLEIPEIKV
jgi:nucleoid-associated protein YgaU